MYVFLLSQYILIQSKGLRVGLCCHYFQTGQVFLDYFLMELYSRKQVFMGELDFCTNDFKM